MDGSAPDPPASRPEKLPSPGEVSREIAAALDALPAPPRAGKVLGAATPDRERLLRAVRDETSPNPEASRELAADLLQQARQELEALPSDHTLGDFVNNDSLVLSAVLSRVAEKDRLLREIPGTETFELFDAGWVASVANRLAHQRAKFRSHNSPTDFRVEVDAEVLTIAMVGDWGTGLPSSLEIAKHMTALAPDFTIHLGDVYYSGTKNEVKNRFLPHWPAGSRGTFALNSNHEMYAGGHGYFDLTLGQDSAISRNQKASYFCLVTRGWQIIGLDSAYEAPDFLYQKGRLSDSQLEWLKAQLAEGARLGKRSIVLTHHNPLDFEGKTDQGLLDQLLAAAEPNPFEFWYWAHEHVAGRFAPYVSGGKKFNGRCVGHGGVPYSPETAGSKGNGIEVEWTEIELAGDAQEPRRARNGFVFLRLDSRSKTVEETFFDEFGAERTKGTF